MKKLVLCSGGVKSSFLAVEMAKEDKTTLLFLDWNQSNRSMEEKAARKIADFCKSELMIEEIKGLPSIKEPLLRFLAFFCWAVPVAKAHQCQSICHGLSRDDLSHAYDPKTAEEFIAGLQHVLNISLPRYNENGLWLKDTEIDTPLRRLTLKHVIRLGNEWRIKWEDTWSCEMNGVQHCGICNKCLRRQKAFKLEGSVDPTVYGNTL